MPADMLDSLQEQKIKAMNEFIDKWEVSAAGNDLDDMAAAIADWFVDEGIGLKQDLKRFWDYYWTAALAGKIKDLPKEGAKLRSVLEQGIACLARGAAVARQHAEFSGQKVARLDLVEEQSKAFPLWVEESMAKWNLLDRPRKPLDRQRTAEAQEAFKRGDYESVSDVIARLEEGGPLVKE